MFRVWVIVLLVFHKDVPFSICPNTSHSNISKFKVAVVAVPWVLMFNMWLWLRFWGSRNQKRVI